MNIIKFVWKIEYQTEVIAEFFSNVKVLEDWSCKEQSLQNSPKW